MVFNRRAMASRSFACQRRRYISCLRIWAALDAARIETRQLLPAQTKAFAASHGTRAKTERIDAELIARFRAFRPDAVRNLPHEKLRLLRALTSKRGQLVETRKRLLAQIKAHGKLVSADMFEAMNCEFKDLLNRQIAKLEAQIEQLITTDDGLAKTADVLRSVPGIGPVASTMLIAKCRNLGKSTAQSRRAHRLCALCPRQRRDARQACHRRRSAIAQACDAPGCPCRQLSQTGLESLRRSPAHRRKTTQGRHHRRRKKAGHNRQRACQVRTKMDSSGCLRNTVANQISGI